MPGSTLTALPVLLLLISIVQSASAKTCALSDVQRNGTLIADCDVLCKPAGWTDLTIFYIGNYFAHVATIRTEPGQAWQDSMLVAVNALFFPSTGLLAAVKAIATGAVFARTPLQTATKAGALYMVVKVPEWVTNPHYLRREVPDSTQPQDQVVQEPTRTGRLSGEAETAVLAPDGGSNVEHTQPQSQPAGATAPAIDAIAKLEKPEAATDLEPQRPVSPRRSVSQADIVIEVSPEKIEEHSRNRQTGASRRSVRQYDPEFAGLYDDDELLRNTVHGKISLPQGYTLGRVPAYAAFEGEGDGQFTLRSFLDSLFKSSGSQPEHTTELAQDYSFLKAAVALGQALYAVSTLYKTRGGQIQQFGYVAYGFTVLPYAFMSTINLISNLICPEYSAIFIVENEELRKLRQKLEQENKSSELVFEGCVGRLSAATEEKMQQTRVEKDRQGPLSAITWQLTMIVAGLGVYLAVVGGLTGFSKGNSTHAQRAWIMTWYCFGVVMGPYLKFFLDGSIVPVSMATMGGNGVRIFSIIGTLLIYATPAIGGLVVVGQEIKQYGVCEGI